MCAPALLVGAQAMGGLYSAVQQRAIGRQNAALARTEAAQMQEIGAFNERQARDRMDRLIARQRGQLAGRGVRLDSAAALDLGDEAGREKAMEAAATRFNTRSRVQAKTAEAAISDFGARTALANGVFNTGARVLQSSLELWPELGA